jgi:Transposase DDE domain group 1
MSNLPFRDFERNRVWLELVRIAHDLLCWTRRRLLTGQLARCEPKRLRYRLLHVAGRLSFHARAATLRLQANWPWADLAIAFERLRALPRRPDAAPPAPATISPTPGATRPAKPARTTPQNRRHHPEPTPRPHAGSAATASTGPTPHQPAKHSHQPTSRTIRAHVGARPAFRCTASCSPKRARRTNRPAPGLATSWSFSTTTCPRTSTTCGAPSTSVPSKRL